MTVHQLIPAYAYIYEREDDEGFRYELDQLDPIPDGFKLVGYRVGGTNFANLKFEEQRKAADPLAPWHNFTITNESWGKL